MSTLPTNDVQKFLGGMLAYIGSQAAVQTSFLILGPAKTDSVTIMVTAFPAVALLIGIRMFLGKQHALSWALVFLTGYILLGLGTAVTVFLRSSASSPLRSYIFTATSVELLAPTVLLVAIILCRFRWRPDASNA